MYSPGADSPLATAHRVRAIGGNPTLVAERQFLPDADEERRLDRRQSYARAEEFV